ncbi:MAG: rRNA maturation RNase YbeY [Eubacteriales bacterium]|nr:rRNA maturation RNase YbeY [Eubacteriales bacterium]
MTVNIENEYENAAGFLSEAEYTKLAHDVINAALDHENCPYEIDVSLLLTDDEAIRELNKEYREMDKSTDVLSFPMIDYESPACFDGFDDMDELFDPDSGELMLGDIVISIDHCIAQAKEYGHSITREYAFLIAHSMLHLMGYDHMTPEEAAEMEKRQEEILAGLGINR